MLAFFLILAFLGALFVLVINPKKVPFRRQLLVMLCCSLVFAPFVAAGFYFGANEDVATAWYRKIAVVFLFGPALLLIFAGIQSLHYALHQIGSRVWRWWRGDGDRSAS